ncbi:MULTISPECIES: S41 family peptidase [Tissierellales]|jgi:carboxyl-terminal processing protease|uniref:S41 family peptidase n=1 Tax=Acidilutibacter cellobiosedens TaxID=2507161 RepID=A0A410QAL2_9FIRM|nr:MULTISPECIES: S41 family peptidase [Tissierellales]QAT60914.1 S41 family peptidase [Acidilutibacter cellobiosedens]SCL90812.1 Carboxy-terminal processing protease CtpA precursor [Sporanaerobacter sp. PP17-6a]
MSKKKKIIGIILLLVVTNVLTFIFSNVLSLTYDNKVILPKDEYNQLSDMYKKYSKNLALEDFIKKNYLKNVDEETLANGELKGMFQSLNDPYSTYMTKDEFEDFTEHTKGIYGGIGVIVTPGDDNLITVVSPIDGTPGEKAGIKTGDKITKVNGKEFNADTMDQAVKVMKGDPGTKVNITIVRKDKEGNNKEMDITIVREEIRLQTVSSDIIEGNIGYINITSFDDLTYKDFKKEINGLMDKNIKGIILDLRNNPGGLLDVCVDIADEFLDKGIVVYTQTRDGQKEYLRSDNDKIDLPLVVLVNKGSASASEILAGAIKDRGRGTLVGTTTFGKGIVQRIKQLSDGSGFKLTVSQYFTPKGINIHGVGIKPNVEVELPENVETIGVENLKNDTQLQKGLEILKGKINQ